MKRLIRTAVRRIAPQWTADRARAHERAYRRSHGLPDLARRLDTVVQSGPCRGLRYPEARLDDIDAPVAKLLGTYELELHWVFEAAIRDRLAFFDIGSADGYWAVGMALRGLHVVAWDISPNARELCAEVADLNEVPVDVRTKYEGEQISDGFVLCDIEGAERDLLTADVARGLPTVLVEVHEGGYPGTGQSLRTAFAATHRVTQIDQIKRKTPEALRGWSDVECSRALSEYRPAGLHWLLFER